MLVKIHHIQSGDNELRNELIIDYTPFVVKTVSEVCKRHIDAKKDDEFCIGLLGFNQAIDLFSGDKGNSFLAFSKVIIKRKVIDYIRTQKDRYSSYSLDENNESTSFCEDRASLMEFRKKREQILRKEEIFAFKQEIEAYGIDFLILNDTSPKHIDAKERAIELAQLMLQDEALMVYLEEKKKLPITRLLEKSNVSKKTIERNRNFIIAVIILLKGDFLHLKQFLKIE